MTTSEERLDRETRCLLAFRGARGPLIVPMAYWFDGAALWMTTAHDTVKARVLRRDGACAVYLPSDEGGSAVIARGRARIFSLADPLGLMVRPGVIAGALTALALRNAPTLLGYARDVTRIPARWAPQNRVVVRIQLDELVALPSPAIPPGVAPALPAVVPSDVRRALSGRRDVAIATVEGSAVHIEEATWGPGLVLARADGTALVAADPAAVVLDADAQDGPVGVVGLILHGSIDHQGTLRPQRATWWRGFSLETVDVPAPAPGGIELPD